jgi:hypothetical protein
MGKSGNVRRRSDYKRVKGAGFQTCIDIDSRNVIRLHH